MKTFLTCCLAALLGFGLLAARPAQAKQHLLLGSSIVGGSYYVLGGTYAKYINDTYPDLDVSVEVGGGPYSNITLLSNGEIDLGFATTWATGEMYDGINDQKKKHEDIRAFLPLFPSYLQIYSLAESPIKSMGDIQGKIASSGAAGSSGRIATQTLFDILGIKPAKLNRVPTGTQINNMRDKLIDVGLSVTGVPAPFMMELEASPAVHLIPLTKQEMDTVLAKQPYWSAGVIKKGTYKSATEDVDAVAFWNVAITSKRLSEDTVYTLTKAGFEAQAQLANAVRDIEHMKPEDILKSTIPLHKGAIRYYRERGIQIPDRLIPPEAK